MQQVGSSTINFKIVYSEDAKAWDKYVEDCISEELGSGSYQLQIVNESIENVQLNKSNDQQSIVNLIILSPGFIVFVEQNDSLRNYFRQFKADSTLCILCGVTENELNKKIKENLVMFDSWKCIVARSQDSKFIFKVIDLIRDILSSKNFKNDIYSPFMPTMKYKREIPDYSSDYKNLDAIKIIDDNENKEFKNTKSKFKLVPRKIRKVCFEFLNDNFQ